MKKQETPLVDLDLPALRRRAKRELFREQGARTPIDRREAVERRRVILARAREVAEEFALA